MLLIKNYGDLCTAAYNIWCSIVTLQIFTTLGCSLQQQNGALYSIKPSLVRHDEILLGFDVINNWDNELEEMNKYKVGQQPFHYTNNFLLLLGYAKAYFPLPYRQTEGISQAHAKKQVPSIPYYTTINRQINKLNIKIINYNNITTSLKMNI